MAAKLVVEQLKGSDACSYGEGVRELYGWGDKIQKHQASILEQFELEHMGVTCEISRVGKQPGEKTAVDDKDDLRKTAPT